MPRNSAHPAGPGASEAGLSDDATIAAAAAEWFARRDAGLPPAQERALQRWLAADARHAAAFARLDSAWSTFGKASRTGGADELLQELAARATRRRRRTRAAAAAAAVFLLAIAAGSRFSRPGEAVTAAPGTATLLVPVTQVLPDGSVVSLKDGAQFANAFTPTLRRVELQHGQALFEVAKNDPRPFVVAAGGIEVRAVGTAFSVQIGRTEVEVLVTEGTVAVAPEASRPAPAGAAPRDDAAPETRVRPGDGVRERPVPAEALAAGVRVEAGNRIVVELAAVAPPPQVQPVATAELAERLAWSSQRVEFSATPLADAVALMNRAAAGRQGLNLVVDDPALGAVRVSGLFRTDNLDAFVLLLETGFGVKAERAGSTIRLRRELAVPAR